MTRRPRLLDLYCGAGGSGTGYARAGFEVFGVDLADQPRYPFPHERANALTYPLRGFDAVHASPPCQDHSVLQAPARGTGWQLAAILEQLASQERPWIVENVEGARSGMGGAWSRLCGSSFGLGVRRHRLFASSVVLLVPDCAHALQTEWLDVTGGGPDYARLARRGVPNRKPRTLAEARAAMGIDWMTRHELNEAIPPAYTEYLGAQLIAAV